MFEHLGNAINELLGLSDGDALTISQMAVRGMIVYAYAIGLVRIASTRFLGSNTAFDAILGFILGSVLSRAVTGNSPFFPTLVAAAILVGLHWLFAVLAVRLDVVAPVLKGRRRQLVENGEILWEQMRRSNIGERDLYEGMRGRANTDDLGEIESAYLERNGQISFIKKKSEPAILDISVADGVQTVRIQLG